MITVPTFLSPPYGIGFTPDASFRAEATGLASATLACIVICAAANLWGAAGLYNVVFLPRAPMLQDTQQEVTKKSPSVTVTPFVLAQAISCFSAFLALAIFGRRLFLDRGHYSDGDVRGGAGYALVVVTCICSFALLLRHFVVLALEKRRAAAALAASRASRRPSDEEPRQETSQIPHTPHASASTPRAVVSSPPQPPPQNLGGVTLVAL